MRGYNTPIFSTKQMKYLHQFFDNPWELIAYDEALLDWAETNNPNEGVLFTWESERHFVVPGFSNRIETEIFLKQCQKDGIPIIRRISGGGTVVQGPGCLNYSIFLPIENNHHLATVTSTNRYIMQTQAHSLGKAFSKEIKVEGITDLVYLDRKFSGNAQRRKRRNILFHGTLLYSFDLELITRYLKFPSLIPDYREDKSHREFVDNFPATADEFIEVLKTTWNAEERLSPEIAGECHERGSRLAKEKFMTDEWNFRV